MPQATSLTTNQAIDLLKSFSSIHVRILESDQEKQQLQQALQIITQQIDHQNFGICASNSQEGLASLTHYLKALGYGEVVNIGEIETYDAPVYIKCNTQKMTYYLDPYSGTYRGVLIACQSENDALIGTFGHFPLDLFDN